MSPDQLNDFTRQWTATLPKVAAFVGSMVHAVSDREDVLQDCAVAAMTSFERYDSERPFAAWATGVARNQVRLYLRRKSRDPHVFDESAMDALVSAFTRVRKDQLQQLSDLDRCVEKLDSKSRQLCELRYSMDLKPREIAQRLNAAPNTISKALQRMRDQLRRCLEKSPQSTP